MNTTLYNALHYVFGLLSLITIFILFLLTLPVVHVLADEIVPVH
jgi:hypothetical protein